MIKIFTSSGKTSALFIILLICVSFQNSSAQWSAMGNGFNGPVRAVAVVGSTLYAAGKFTMSGTTAVSNIAQWNGSAWTPLTSGVNDSVNALISFNGELYVAGAFSSAGGVNGTAYIAKWNGSAWSSVGTFNAAGRSFTIFKGSLIASGYFSSPASKIAKYISSTTWTSIGNGSPAGVPFAMTTHEGQLYVGGDWGDPVVQYLDTITNNWTSINAGCIGEVRTLASYKKSNQVQLYIGGDVSASSAYKLLTYYAPSYSYPVNPFNMSFGNVNCIYSNADYIYAGGGFKVSPSGTDITMLARYNGGFGLWTTFGNGASNFNAELLSLCAYNNFLVAGGRFTTFGGTTMNYISISSMLTATEEHNDGLISNTFYPNPVQDNARLQIESKNILNKPVLKIFDVLGKEMNAAQDEIIFGQNRTQAEFGIDGSLLSPGIYYYSVTDGGITIATGKIVRSN